MKTRTLLLATIAFALLAAGLIWWGSKVTPTPPQPAPPEPLEIAVLAESAIPKPMPATRPSATPPTADSGAHRAAKVASPDPALTKPDRLNQVRSTFTALAAGDAKTSLT